MWEFKFYSRGGQGAVTASKILINAAIIENRFGQAIPSYGQERKGAPVYAYARIAADPIEVKSYVYRPNCVMVFDRSLPSLGIDIFEGIREGSVLVVNAKSTDEMRHPNLRSIVAVDADAVTREVIGDVPPNVAMLGALAKGTGCVDLKSLEKAILLKIPGKAGELNAKACRRAYEQAKVAQKA
ncbi:MAG: 2-oxoacid:acceptor oxidoreductase family protein [Bacillota bacterium]|jgi:pyruvate ferredoxin oxidoreductase gamma subunit/2-oxoisovalerate ferredoxin oxidoreductase gamma subunit